MLKQVSCYTQDFKNNFIDIDKEKKMTPKFSFLEDGGVIW